VREMLDLALVVPNWQSFCMKRVKRWRLTVRWDRSGVVETGNGLMRVEYAMRW
jgi:hypothetical protein